MVSSRPTNDPPSGNPRPLAILGIHVTVFAVLLAWSWRKWPDPLVDFGREMYLPWQINEGRVLYRDLASLFGPLSPYVNALWFRLFSTSLLTLALCNVGIFAATTAGIYHLVRVSTDRVAGAAASLGTVLLFGFSQYDAVGNYNFVTPYSHEATHGIALSVASLVSLQRALNTGSRRFAAVSGASFGLTLLTKPEIAVAAAAAVLVAWSAAWTLAPLERRDLASNMSLFIAAAAIPSLVFFFHFATQMAPREAMRATAGAWIPLFGTGITGNQFYRHSMGLDAPVTNASAMLWTYSGFLAFVAGAIAVSWNGACNPLVQRLSRIGLLVGVVIVGRRGTLPRALPLVVFTTLVAAIVFVMRARSDRDRAFRLIPLVAWSAFALVLLTKMVLNARLSHYGFYLALPAMVAATALMTWVIPQALATWRSDAAARGFRQLAFWALTAVVALYLGTAHAWNRTKTLTIGSGSDRFYASTKSAQGRLVLDALEVLEQTVTPGATLAVMPEGVILNYLMRLDSSLHVVNLMPPEMLAFGEDNVLRSLARKPPDFVMLIDRDTGEYGYPTFGSDPRYGLSIVRWVNEHYERVRDTGGTQLFRRRVS